MPTLIAAIDAGSNGLRLIIAAVDDAGRITKVRTDRESLRLGHDVFTRGAFTEASTHAAVEAFRKFRRILDEHNVARAHTLAVATSATRDAANGDDLVRRVAEATGIEIDVIDAIEEARLVLLAIADHIDLRGKTAVLIDMGGGSVEATVVRDGRALRSESYPLGPVRLLRRLEESGQGEADAESLLRPHRGAITRLIRSYLNDQAPDLCIAVGGNAEQMSKLPAQLLHRPRTNAFTPADLDALIPNLLATPLPQRIDELNMRPDRADVIAIAMMVMRQIIRETNAPEALAPGVDLKDGLLRQTARLLRSPSRSSSP